MVIYTCNPYFMTEIPLSQTTPDAKIVDTLQWIQSEKKEAVNAVLWDIKKALEGLKGEINPSKSQNTAPADTLAATNSDANIKLRVPLLYNITKKWAKETYPAKPSKTPQAPTQYTQPGADGLQIPTTWTNELGIVNPITNAQIGAIPAFQESWVPIILPGWTLLPGGPLQ